ncbi:GHKL domain-containing protein [Coprobacillus cateniformis]|nr:GHKL domain-containing protein [Coprobacillus cateniformis]
MNYIINIFLNLIITFTDLFLIEYYLKNKLTCKKESNLYTYYFIQFICLFVLNSLITNNKLISFLILLLSLFVSIHKYKYSLTDLIKFLIIFLSLKMIVEVLISLFFEWIFDVTLYVYKTNKYFVYNLFIRLINRYIMFIFILYFTKYYYKQPIKKFKYFKIISLFLSVYFSLIVIIYNDKIFYFDNIGRTFIFVILLYNFALIAFNKYQTIHEILERDMLQTNERILAEKRFIERKVEADENIKRMRHDLKNNYYILNGYANDGNIEEIKKFLEARIGILDKSSSFIHSGHSCIDSILNEKIFIMKEKNIQYTENLAHMYIGDIDVSDLSLLIGLALDNAIEAAEQVNDFKEIDLTAKNYQGYLVLYFKNSIIPNSYPDFNKTSKLSDSFNHGFGVKGIKQFAKIYNGEIKYITEKNKVILRVTLSVSNG